MTLELRPYQVEAVDRIVERGTLLLALTMGAGKTVAAVSAIRHLRRQRTIDKGVIFALKSTKWQWVREIAKVDPRAKVQVVDGDKRSRVAAIRRAGRYHYTIMHYECLVNDWDVITRVPAHRLHDPGRGHLPSRASGPRASRAAKALGQTFKRPYRPYQDSRWRTGPRNCSRIMEFVDPEVLGSFHKFDRTFIVRDHYGQAYSATVI